MSGRNVAFKSRRRVPRLAIILLLMAFASILGIGLSMRSMVRDVPQQVQFNSQQTIQRYDIHVVVAPQSSSYWGPMTAPNASWVQFSLSSERSLALTISSDVSGIIYSRQNTTMSGSLGLIQPGNYYLVVYNPSKFNATAIGFVGLFYQASLNQTVEVPVQKYPWLGLLLLGIGAVGFPIVLYWGLPEEAPSPIAKDPEP